VTLGNLVENTFCLLQNKTLEIPRNPLKSHTVKFDLKRERKTRDEGKTMDYSVTVTQKHIIGKYISKFLSTS
jgi:hypothetical protein